MCGTKCLANTPISYLGGFIITGGVSNMKNIEKAFKQHTGVDKIRIANFVQETINSNIPEITAHRTQQ